MNNLPAHPELHPSMRMTRAQKLARAEDKRRLVMDFLGSGEVYSTISVLARLMGVSEQTAQPVLKRLVEEKMLKVEKNAIPFSNLKLWGISAHGLALTETSHPKCPEFSVGKTSASFVAHHIEGQHVRLDLELAGWTNYIPGKLLMVENSQRKNKCIADAQVTRPDERLAAIEIERHVKSRARLALVIAAHLQQIVEKRYEYVYYFTPHRVALERAFLLVLAIRMDGAWVKLTAAHRSRFKILDMDFFRKGRFNYSVIIDPTL